MEAVALAAVIVTLAAFVAAPLYRVTADSDPKDRPELEARRDSLIAALRELELDHASGLVEEDVYTSERMQLESEAASLLRRLSEKDTD